MQPVCAQCGGEDRRGRCRRGSTCSGTSVASTKSQLANVSRSLLLRPAPIVITRFWVVIYFILNFEIQVSVVLLSKQCPCQPG